MDNEHGPCLQALIADFPITAQMVGGNTNVEDGMNDRECLSPMAINSAQCGPGYTIHEDKYMNIKAEDAQLASFRPEMDYNAWGITLGEHIPETYQNRTIDRKEIMKVYMRNYRRRQKTTLDSLPSAERETILQKQRERVRERVRRHRFRKKLRASGAQPAEIERQVQELLPQLTQQQNVPENYQFSLGQQQKVPQQQMAICLDMPVSLSSFSGHLAPGDLRRRLPEVYQNTSPFLGSHSGQAPVLVAPGQFTKCDFELQPHQEMHFQPPNLKLSADMRTSEMKLSPSSWSSSQVGVFLDGLELSHLKTIFERHHVTGIGLLSLTSGRLCEMGIDHIEIQKEILNAIDSLKRVSLFN
uniref:SAM domain-containing protein n=1 Tax=Spongospora subterranea TaxID=70186 RepID=A0A0H5R8X0_9EUKA|eukprot:CRZ10162.1 hypothetical protein [Spongospora subterranea]